MPTEDGYRPPAGTSPSGGSSKSKSSTPALPTDERSKWSIDLLKALGYPVTMESIKFINAWQQAEGTKAAFNPLATTQHADGASSFNSIGVRNYTSRAQGIKATVQTLTNGRYNNVIGGLQRGESASQLASHYTDLNTWSGGAGKYVANVLGSGSGNYGGSSAAMHGGGGGGSDEGNTEASLTGSDLDGYQLSKAMIKANPELWKLWQKAISQDWDATKFGLALKNTNYWKNHTGAQRSALYLEKTDPAEYQKQLHDRINVVKQLAAEGGAQLDSGQIQRIAEKALIGGWDDAALKSTLAHYIDFSHGSLAGSAGETEDYLRKYASDMGVRVGDNWIQKQAQSLFAGTGSLEQSKDYIDRLAVSSFPGLKDQIANGVTVRDAASPYLNGMSSILEVNPESVDLFDPTIRKALTSVDKDGKSTLTPLWQFESQLKKDPRWLQTNNARDDLTSTTHKLLQDWGLSV